LERGQLRTLVDNLKQKLGEGVVVLASAQPEGKVALIAGVTPGLTKRIQAGKLVGGVAKLVGGSGGGKPEIAEAGGKDQAQIDAALKAAPGIVGECSAPGWRSPWRGVLLPASGRKEILAIQSKGFSGRWGVAVAVIPFWL
jgi:hypothetical protein